LSNDSAITPPASREAAPEISDHTLVRRIGAGSYGEVWLALNVLGEARAVKVIYRHRFADPRPFEREFEGIQRFEPISRSHPSQLAILHVGKNDAGGWFYYVMELADPVPTERPLNMKLEGEAAEMPERPKVNAGVYAPRTLRSDLEQYGRLPIRDCVQIGLSLTTALAHLHQHGLVHRDIKPSNVLFVNGVPKLGDIGLVTEAGDTQSIVGTEGYIPPEGPGTAQADIFSLGKVLYEISTGMDRRRFAELPQDLHDWKDRGAVVEFNEILLRACAKDTARRYRSAQEMRDELALLESGKSVKRARAREQRRSYVRNAAVGIGVLALVAAVGLTSAVWRSRPPSVEWSKNESANEAYRKGLRAFLFNTGSPSGTSEAVKYFETATQKDPKFAEAYAKLAHSYVWQGPDNPTELTQARAMAERALSLNGKLDEAHRELGWTKAILERDWVGAEKEYRRAISLNPFSEDNLYGYANLMAVEGHTAKAVELANKALRLDSRSIMYLQNAGWIFSAAHQYDRAIEKFDEVIKLEPSSRTRVARLLAPAWREKGLYLKAIQIEEEAALLEGGDGVQVRAKSDSLRSAYLNGGAKAYWNQQLNLLKGADDPVLLAGLYARVDDKDKAFHYLNVACAEKPAQLAFRINREPNFDSLREDFRFTGVLRKLGLGR
jgi:serine/threonine protein kinase